MAKPTYREVFLGLMGPWIFMSASLTFLPGTLLRLVSSSSFSTLLSPSAFQAAWFSDFWAWAGPSIRDTGGARVVALLRGNIHRGAVKQEEGDEAGNGGGRGSSRPPHPPVSGTIIEVGPGSGMWVSLFAEAANPPASDSSPPTASSSDPPLRSRNPPATAKGAAPAVKRVLGVEPNRGVHAALSKAVTDAGLDGVYEVIPCGIEDLGRTGMVRPGEVDCIVSILCLCGIPEPQRNIRALYGYLKPGGRWYAYEHVKCDSCRSMVWYQSFVNLFWPHFLGGCQLTRNTGKWLREAGPWSNIDLAQPPDEPWFHIVPHVLGILTK